MTAWRPTWPAARTMRLPIAVKASACSTTSRSARACAAARSATRAPHRGGRSRCPPGQRHRRHLHGRCIGVHVLDARREELPVQEGNRATSTSRLPDGTGDDDYLSLLRLHLAEVLNRHQPDFVFYLAGADPFEGDRLGRLKLTIDGLRRARRDRVARLRRRRAARGHHDERRLRERHRRHRYHSRQHDSHDCIQRADNGPTLSPPERTTGSLAAADERPDRGHGIRAGEILGAAKCCNRCARC